MKRALTVFGSVVLIFALCLSIGLSLLKIYMDENLDYETDELLFLAAKSSNTTTYLAYDGGNLVEVYKEHGNGAKTWSDISEVSPHLINAFLSAEDREFYNHGGVNIKRTIGAALNFIFHFSPSFGASTITQQVIKNISGDNERTVARKLSELFRAWNLERTQSKDDILEMYLNIVPMSRNIYGVTEASRTFFNKEPSELTLAEAATVVGITNSPGRYDPYSNPKDCIEKRNRVLYAMRDTGYISDEIYRTAISEGLGISDKLPLTKSVCSWFIETAREDIIEDLSEKYSITKSAARLMLSAGTRVILTLDPQIQAAMEKIFEEPANLPDESGTRLRYGMVINDNESGDLVGIIGDGGLKQANRLLNYATALHTPGSTLKPIALYAPLIENDKINWSTIFDDVPKEYGDIEDDAALYPKNSPNSYDGMITVSEALKRSKNTVAYDLYNMEGGEKIYKILTEDYGFNSIVRREAIGTDENKRVLTDIAFAPLGMGQLTHGISLRSLTDAYTVFPCCGIMKRGRSYYGVFDNNGNVILEKKAEEKRIMSRETAEIMNMMLSGVVEDGTAKGVRLKELVDTAGKTGTSGQDHDRLFVGYTPYYTAGIWCGYSDGKSAVGQKSPNHIEIWDKVMGEVHERKIFKEKKHLSGFSLENIQLRKYCSITGMLAEEGCEEMGNSAFGYYKLDKGLPEYCEIHKKYYSE